MAPRRPSGRAHCCALALCTALAACGAGDDTQPFDRVTHLSPVEGAGDLLEMGGEARRGWRLRPGQSLSIPARIQGDGRLELSVTSTPGASSGAASSTTSSTTPGTSPGATPALPAPTVIVALEAGETRAEPLLRAEIGPGAGWQTLGANVSSPDDGEVMLHLSVESAKGAESRDVLIGEVQLLEHRRDRERPPNVVLVTIDTTRADVASDPRVAPNLAALADTGIAFDRAWSSATTTSAGHASILTGLPVVRHGTVSNRSRLDEAHRTLAEALRELGLQTAASVSVDHLGPDAGFGQGFDRFRPAARGDAGDGRRALEPALAWLDEWQRDGARPFFLWLHVFDPHTPYGPPKEFLGGAWAERGFRVPGPQVDPPTSPVFPGGPPVPLDWLAGVSSREHVESLYRASVGYADHLIGTLLAALDASGERHRSLIVVTSDHGEALGEQDVWYQHAGLFPASLRVPLIVALPDGPSGVRSRARVSTLDIVPSVLRAVSGRSTSGPGRDWLDTLTDPDPSRRVWFAESGLDQLGFRDGDVHFALALRPGQFGVRVDRRDGVPRVVGINTYRPGASWLFDVNADPELTHNLARDPGAGASRYRERVRARAAESTKRIRLRSLGADEEQRLRALGYLPDSPSQAQPMAPSRIPTQTPPEAP